jgi:hypothetical protein
MERFTIHLRGLAYSGRGAAPRRIRPQGSACLLPPRRFTSLPALSHPRFSPRERGVGRPELPIYPERKSLG